MTNTHADPAAALLAARAALAAAIRAAIRAAECGDEVAYARAAGNLEAARAAYHDAADKAAIEAAYNSGLGLRLY